MSSMQHLIEGFDPTVGVCITMSELLQMIRNAYPVADQGFVIISAAAPDVVTYPELAGFLWLSINSPTDADLHFYNGSSWELFPVKIADGSITLNKIDLTGSSPFYIIQVNGAGTALNWVDIISAIQNNTLPPIKLLLPDNVNKFVLTGFAGVKAFQLIADFFNNIDDNIIPITKLVKGAADPLQLFLNTKADGSTIQWSEIDVANLAAANILAGQSIKRNAGNTAWVYYTPVNPLNESGLYALPAPGAVQQIPHGLTSIPRLVDVRLQCISGVNGYSIGDQIHLSMPIGVYAGAETTPQYTFAVDAINITVISGRYGGVDPTTGIYYQPKGGGDAVVMDTTKWQIKANFIQ